MTRADSFTGWVTQQIALPDGRKMETLTFGTSTTGALVFHPGTPEGPTPDPALAKVALDAGLRLVVAARPGYGRSDACPGRSVADVTQDLPVVLDRLGITDFVTLGVSGGGPHALACAALLPARCRAAASVVGLAPWTADPGVFLADMGRENVEEFTLAAKGRAALMPWLEAQRAGLAEMTINSFIDAFSGVLAPVDLRLVTGDLAEHTMLSIGKALEAGIDGWLDDDLAFCSDWGFDLEAIDTPVSIWHGKLDVVVPSSHAERLARAVPTARLHLLPDGGHFSFSTSDRYRTIVDDLQRRGAG